MTAEGGPFIIDVEADCFFKLSAISISEVQIA